MRTPKHVYLALLATLLIGTSYWVVSFVEYPDEPFIIKILARNQADFNYIILPAVFSQGLYPTGVLEGESVGMSSIPIVSLLVHTVSVAIFGQYGFLLADIAYFLLIFFAARMFFMRIHDDETFACLFAVGILLSLQIHSISYGHWINSFSLRWPRPFVTVPFIFLSLRYMLDLWSDPLRLSPRQFAIFGASLAILGQTDLYFLVSVALAAVVFFVKNVLQHPTRIREFLRLIAWAALGFVVAFLPLLIQKSFADPEFGMRLGMHPLFDRMEIVKDYFMGRSRKTANMLANMRFFTGLLAAEFALFAFLRRFGARAVVERFEFAIPITIICLAACFAMPFFSLVTGMSLQNWHFVVPVRSLRFILAYSAGAAALVLVFDWVSKAVPVRRFVEIGFMIVLVACVVKSYSTSKRFVHRHEIFGSESHWNWLALPERRETYGEVFSFLDDRALPTDTVLAALGLGVRLKDVIHAYWYNSGHHNTLFPNAFVTTLSDDELMLRSWARRILSRGDLPANSKRLRLDVTGGPSRASEFEQALGFCGRYAASRFSRLSEDLADYTPTQQKRIRSSTWDKNWYLVMPRGEVRRWMKLLRLHRDTIEDRYRVDVALSRRHIGQVKGFRLVFENIGWKIWVNESSPASALFPETAVVP